LCVHRWTCTQNIATDAASAITIPAKTQSENGGAMT
jgi:hypothetical protein